MPRYRRSHCEWGTYFLTLVTHERHPLFREAVARDLLHQSMRATFAVYPMNVHEMVLLPDHLHMLCTMPEDDSDYSLRIKHIKRRFTRAWLKAGGHEGPRNASRRRAGERGIWQRRFYEHTIRNQREYRDHVAYVHMNPVKHKLVTRPVDWPWSTFHRHVKEGLLEDDWCGPTDLRGVGECDNEVW
jgi:putative transposase